MRLPSNYQALHTFFVSFPGSGGKRAQGAGISSEVLEGPRGLGSRQGRLSQWARTLPPLEFLSTLTPLPVPGRGEKA